MIQTDDKILLLMQKPASADIISTCSTLQNDMKVHVTGENYLSVLKQIIGYENVKQFAQKKELAEPVTMVLSEKIISEQSRWTNAQGTNKHYEFKTPSEEKTEQMLKILSDVYKGESMDYFVKNILKEALYTEFCGFLMIEQERIIVNENSEYLEREGSTRIRKENEKPRPYIIIKKIEDIYDFKCKGNKVEYIITKFGKRKIAEKEYELYRYIDDAQDIIIQRTGGKYEILKEPEYKKLKNELGYVPAIQISLRHQNILVDEVKISPMQQCLPYLRLFLTQWADHVISCLLHAYPIYYQIGMKCRHKDEEGNPCTNGTITYTSEGLIKNRPCEACNGTGHTIYKDASTTIILPQVDSEGRAFNISNAAGYVQIPTETLKHQLDELNAIEEKVYFSGTGCRNLVTSSINRTATETMLNLKPLEDIIGKIIDNIEYVETFACDTIGKLYFGDNFIKSQINYGRRLNLRDENEIMSEIEKAKEIGCPFSNIKALIEELIYSKYKNDRYELARNIKLSEIEPFVGFNFSEIENNKYITDEDKKIKFYFNDFIEKYEIENGPIIKKENEEIKEKLKEYAEELTEISTD